MKWNDFLQKLEIAREKKLDGPVRVAAICNLIYCGAFDSMIDGQPTLELYNQMFEDVKRVKESKAKLPSKTKAEFIGLDQVTSMNQLAMWRSQKSPIVKKIGIESEVEEYLKANGFNRINRTDTIWTFSRGAAANAGRPAVWGTAKWSEIFREDRLRNVFGKANLLLYGVVTDVKIRLYGPEKNKEMLSFKVFTGQELTDELVIWPKRQTGQLSEVYKSLVKDGLLAVLHIKPSLYNGKPSGTVLSIEEVINLGV